MKATVARGAVYVSFAALAFLVPSLADADQSPPPDIPIQSWLQGQDRRDFDWKVEVAPPQLTFSQRHLVWIRATFRAGSLLKAGISPLDLHFVVKLAGEDGRWLPGQSYSRFEPPRDLSARDEVSSLSSVYAKPGTYKVAFMAYDSLHQKGNLWRGTVRVPSVVGDPLPGIDKDIPLVEFLTSRFPPVETNGWLMPGDEWTFGQGALSLPVANVAPVQVDVVINLSLSNTSNRRHSEAPDWYYQRNTSRLVAMGHVISEMGLRSGCIRVSVLDILRQELILSEDARSIDWSKIETTVKALNRGRIDARVLAGQQTGAFFADHLVRLATAPPKCEVPQGQFPVRVLIVISNALTFHGDTKMPRTIPGAAWARCYYLERDAGSDQVGTVLKPLNVLRLKVSGPGGFRRALAQLIREQEETSRNRAPPSTKH